MFCLSMFCLFYIFAFRCFVVLCFVIDPSLVGQWNETDVCDSIGNIFVKSNVSMDSAIGYHRVKM